MATNGEEIAALATRAAAFLSQPLVHTLTQLYMMETFTHGHLHTHLPQDWLTSLQHMSHDQVSQEFQVIKQ
eukprot:m.70797 g.70797  ORF g.70797 m.70797 type:complete len:71 (+) comp12269_c0_seq2:102-314(+)